MAEMHSGAVWAAREDIDIIDAAGWSEEGMSLRVQMTYDEYRSRRDLSITRPRKHLGDGRRAATEPTEDG